MSHREIKLEKPLGIIGGMSWVSTQQYYRQINLQINAALGKQHSAPLVVSSVNFQEIIHLQTRGDWDSAGQILAHHGEALERAGCGAFLIASNTMHKTYAHVKRALTIPGINIFDATSAAIRATDLKSVALLGTRYTMTDPFYRDEYKKRGIDVITPDGNDGRIVNEIIFKELIHDVVRTESKAAFVGVIERLIKKGAQAVILGCTEIELLIKPGDVSLPTFDTTALHAQAASEWLLQARLPILT